MGMYCCCGAKKSVPGWSCKCDWDDWFLCYENKDLPKNIPIKPHPSSSGTYLVRVFEDGDYYETNSEFSLTPKDWGKPHNKYVSHWEIDYFDGWLGYRGVFAYKEESD